LKKLLRRWVNAPEKSAPSFIYPKNSFRQTKINAIVDDVLHCLQDAVFSRFGGMAFASALKMFRSFQSLPSTIHLMFSKIRRTKQQYLFVSTARLYRSVQYSAVDCSVELILAPRCLGLKTKWKSTSSASKPLPTVGRSLPRLV
jgi:hypothetical protein